MSEDRLRCRYQVWERTRWISNYQCNNAAKETRPLRLRATKELLEREEELPVCGTHARAVDRNLGSWTNSAYEWDDNNFHARVERFVRKV